MSKKLLNDLDLGNTNRIVNLPVATATGHAVTYEQLTASQDVHTLGQCRLVYVSTTQIRLEPFDGNKLWVEGMNRVIPAAGITLGNTLLTAATRYYVYAYMLAGSLTLEAVTTGYSTDTGGHKIKTGDPTRSLVGMVYMDAGVPGTFADTATKRYVASYFNRRRRALNGTATATTSTSTTMVELSTASRVNAVVWANSFTEMSVIGWGTHTAVGGIMTTQVGVDGAIQNYESSQRHSTVSYRLPIAARFVSDAIAEGFHYFSQMVQVAGAAGTGSWTTGLTGSVEQ